MRRLGASLLVVAFLAVPVLQVRCLIACASDDQESADACHGHHDHDATMATVGEHHDCGTHSASPALTSDARFNLDVALAPAPEFGAAPTGDRSVPARLPFAAPGGPPGPLVVPLRR
jgi:hypothetical protein